MASFAGCEYIERGDGDGSGISYGSQAQGRRHRIPGSNRIVVHRNSTSRHTLDHEGECTAAQLAALRAVMLAQTEGTLTTSKETLFAQLVKVDPKQVFDNVYFVCDFSYRVIHAGFGFGTQYGFYGN